MAKTLKILLPTLVLLLGVGVALVVINSRPAVDRQETTALPPLVRVMRVEPRDLELVVRSQGTVAPLIESTIVAEIAGRVDWTSPAFAEGGFFDRGDPLVRIDRRDYELAVSQAEAQVAQARVRLQLEEAEAELAREEWRQLGEGEANPLALREPQLAEAQAAVLAAGAALEKAQLDLERTTIRAPFDGRVRSKQVDIGQFVNRGTPVAAVYSTDSAEIRLPVPKDELRFVGLDPSYRLSEAGTSPSVQLRAEIGGKSTNWEGTIVRTGSEFDRRSRMLPLFARVEDPLRRHRAAAGEPLPMGLFVDAFIDGIEVEGVFVLPRSALRGGSEVLIVDEEDRLRFRPVEVLRTERDRVIVDRGLSPGERVCISQIETVVDGMPVRTVLEETPIDIEGDEEARL